jgi:hypothetical protein
MEDRRQGERRADERREFRREGGRRDPESPRRRSRLRFLFPIAILALTLGAGLAFRTAVVAPRRSASVKGVDASGRIAPLLAATSLPMLAYPGAGLPAPGEPDGPLPEAAPEAIATLAELDEALSPALRAAPTVGSVPLALGRARLLLGEERRARLAWEAALAAAEGVGEAEARIGLGLVDLRAGLRAEGEQDRSFALERALRAFERAAEDPDLQVDAGWNRSVALALLGRTEEAHALASGLAHPSRSTLLEWLERR